MKCTGKKKINIELSHPVLSPFSRIYDREEQFVPNSLHTSHTKQETDPDEFIILAVHSAQKKEEVLKMKKVLIADDHTLFSSGFALMLEKHPDFEVVGNVTNGNDVLYKVISLCPDIVILDLNLPKKNGIEVLREIKDYNERLVVIILTMYNDAELINEARKTGANAYFLKNSDQVEIVRQMKVLTSKDFYLTSALINSPDTEELKEDEFSSIVKLTNREKEILKHLVEGLSSKEIAEILEISPSTVDTHRKNMLKKLSFNKVSELVSYAYRNNLV